MKLEREPSQLRLIDHLLKEKTWNFLEEHDVRDSDFNGQAKIVIDFIRKYYEDSEEFPPKDFVETETGISFPSEVSRIAATKRFKDKIVEKKLGKYLNDAQRALVEQNVTKAVSIVQEASINVAQPSRKSTSFLEEAEKRRDEYLIEKQKPLKGVIPPFKTWQDNILMWENGTFGTILGIQHVGKSWLTAYIAVHAAFTQGKRVLFVSKENTRKSMQNRLDSLVFSLNFGKLRSHLLDFRVTNRWKRDIEEFENKEGDIFLADGSQMLSVRDVYQEFLVKKPDMVIVDGAYLLSSSRYDDSSELIQSFCHLAQVSDVPWLASTQLKLTANDDRLSTRDKADAAKGNKNWVVAVDTALTITQSNDLGRLGNIIRCDVVKDRDGGDKTGVSKEFHLSMCMKKMTIEEFNLSEYTNPEIINITTQGTP